MDRSDAVVRCRGRWDGRNLQAATHAAALAVAAALARRPPSRRYADGVDGGGYPVFNGLTRRTRSRDDCRAFQNRVARRRRAKGYG